MRSGRGDSNADHGLIHATSPHFHACHDLPHRLKPADFAGALVALRHYLYKSIDFNALRGVARKSGILAHFLTGFAGNPKSSPRASPGDLDPQKSPETFLNTTCRFVIGDSQ